MLLCTYYLCYADKFSVLTTGPNGDDKDEEEINQEVPQGMYSIIYPVSVPMN